MHKQERVKFVQKWVNWKTVGPLLLFIPVSAVIINPNLLILLSLLEPYGFIDKSGNYAISMPSFSCRPGPSSFSQGLCLDEAAGYTDYSNGDRPSELRCVFINQAGKEVIHIEHAYGAESFSEDFAPVMLTNRRKFFDRTGFLLGSAERENNECLAAETSWSYVNKTGKIMPWGPFWQVQKFSEGLAAVRPMRSMKWHFINRNGAQAFTKEFDEVGRFSEGLAAVRTDGKWGLIDTKGKLILPTSTYDRIGEFHEGLAPATRKKEGRLDYLDQHGQVQLSVCKDFATKRRIVEDDFSFEREEFADEAVSDGLIIFEKDGKCGYLDKKGEVAITPQFARCGPFVEGRALYQLEAGGKYGYIDHDGTRVTSCKYSKAHNYSEGLAVVVYDGNQDFSHYIDKAGHDAFNRAYPNAKSFHDGRALAGSRGYL